MRPRSLVGQLLFGALALSLVAVTTVGCGGAGKKEGVTVRGRVTYKNKPLPRGTINFWVDAGANVKAGTIKDDGSYEVKDVPLGSATITLDVPPALSASGRMPMGGGGGGGVKEIPRPKPDIELPDKYKNKSRSTLTYEVVSGENTKDFDLTD